MSTTIKPLSKNLLLKAVAPETKTKSGLYIPETAKDDKTPMIAEVLAVGNSKKIEKKGIKVGDWVIYSKYSGTEVELDGVKYMIVSIRDILATVTK